MIAGEVKIKFFKFLFDVENKLVFVRLLLDSFLEENDNSFHDCSDSSEVFFGAKDLEFWVVLFDVSLHPGGKAVNVEEIGVL